MSFEEQLMRKCIEIYERRKYYSKREGDSKSVIHLQLRDVFLTYRDPFEYKAYRELHRAVERLIEQGILSGLPDETGYFDRLRFHDETIERCYRMTGVTPAAEQQKRLIRLLDRHDREELPILHAFCEHQRALLENHRKLIYGIELREEKLEDVLRVLAALEVLETETNVREFSMDYFGDPEWFEQIRVSVQNILYDFTEVVVEREKMLERFHLVRKPTYLHIKGAAHLSGSDSETAKKTLCDSRGDAAEVEGERKQAFWADLALLPGGLAVASEAIAAIAEIQIHAPRVVVTEDEAAFHEVTGEDAVVICLGGYPQERRLDFLRRLYRQNPGIQYEYTGDLDVYGFLILEEIKARTGIPFQTRQMNLAMLKKLRREGQCQDIKPTERKLFGDPRLAAHEEVLAYMQEHNCKWEWRKAK